MSRPSARSPIVAAAIGGLIMVSACAVGPAYQRPATPALPAFKEAPPVGWKEAQPNESALRGKWWEMYGDAGLNAFESQVSISNQNVLAAEAQLRAAEAAVRVNGADLFPTVTAAPSATVAGGGVSGAGHLYALPVDVTYQADVWGGIRRSIAANRDVAQATAAQLENARLLYQSELASDYFQLEGLDVSRQLLIDAVASYERNLQLTQDRYTGGVASQGDVALAETQLETARAQLVDLGIARAQFEHAIAVLIGKPPADVSVPASATPVAATAGARGDAVCAPRAAAGHRRRRAAGGGGERRSRRREVRVVSRADAHRRRHVKDRRRRRPPHIADAVLVRGRGACRHTLRRRQAPRAGQAERGHL